MSVGDRSILFWSTRLLHVDWYLYVVYHTSKQSRKSKVEYLIKFIGHGPEHNLWQHDMNNYAESVAKNLDVWLLCSDAVPHLVGIIMASCFTP